MSVVAFVVFNILSKEREISEPDVVIYADAQLEKYKNIKIPEEEKIKHEKLMEMGILLYGEHGIVQQLVNELTEKSYPSHSITISYSPEDIRFNIILLNRKATEKEQESVKSIFFQIINENNLDPNVFTLRVSDDKDVLDIN